MTSQLNIRPVFDVHADVQGRDLYSARARTSTRCSRRTARTPRRRCTVTLSGQVETMRESYTGLFTGIGARHRPGVSVPGHELPELDRSADRADGGAVRARRRAVDAVPVADADERAGADGHADVHRPHHRQQHSGGELRQSAHGGRRRSAAAPRSLRATRACARCS